MKANLSKRILAGLLSALMLSSVVACSGGGEGADTTAPTQNDPAATTPAETEPAETEPTVDEWGRDIVKDDIPADLKFEGETLTFLSRDAINMAYEFRSEQLTGDIVKDAIYERNLRVEDRLGITIDQIKRPGGGDSAERASFTALITNDNLSGANEFNVVANYAYYATAQTVLDCYTNLAELPNVNYEKPWWNQGYIKAASIHGQFFTVVSDLNLSAIERAVALFYNKRLVQDYGLENIYEIVLNGEWTVDKMIEITKDIARDLNGNNNFDAGDFYGIVGGKGSTTFDPLFPALGISMVSVNSDGEASFTLDVDLSSTALDKLLTLFYANNSAFLATDGSDGNKFKAGESLFWVALLASSQLLRDMDDDFGLLPLPKYTVEQEAYHTTAQDAYNAMSVMRNAKNMEMIGAALELLSAESWRTVRPQLCENSFKFRYMRDSESGQIFDIIVDGITFDHAILYSTAINNAGWLIRDELNNNRNNLSSSLRAYTKMYNRSLEKLNAYFLDRGAE